MGSQTVIAWPLQTGRGILAWQIATRVRMRDVIFSIHHPQVKVDAHLHVQPAGTRSGSLCTSPECRRALSSIRKTTLLRKAGLDNPSADCKLDFLTPAMELICDQSVWCFRKGGLSVIASRMRIFGDNER
jgi:hypothetical protein